MEFQKMTEEELIMYIEEGHSLREIPVDCRTLEVCLMAVKRDGKELAYVPKDVVMKWDRDEEALEIADEIWIEALKQNGEALEFIPEFYRSQKLCSLALHQTPRALSFVPEDMITEELCLETVKRDGMTLGCVPMELVVDPDNDMFDYDPGEYPTKEIFLEAVKQNGKAIVYVPEDYQNFEICLEAVTQAGSALELVPDHFRDRIDFCAEAVKRNNAALKFVPEDIRADVQDIMEEFVAEQEEANTKRIRGLMKECAEEVPCDEQCEAMEVLIEEQEHLLQKGKETPIK